MKQIVFALLPALLIFGGAELLTRLLRLDRPTLFAGGQAVIGPDTLIRADPLLGWSLRPGFRGRTKRGQPVSVNSRGMRSGEIPVPKGNEYRILSLGESTTFGIEVGDDETYSARLEQLLGMRPGGGRPVRVLNAGVSAWSSTQSLLWLKERGLELAPDMILFYHEVNDYLPATLRDTEMTERELFLTDRQLYQSPLHKVSRFLVAHSALYRGASYTLARRRIVRLDDNQIDARIEANALADIGFPQQTTFDFLEVHARDGDRRGAAEEEIIPELLGRRVSEKERRENLESLAEICRRLGIPLVLIHPSYRLSAPHECLLTRFCRERGVPLFDAHPFLHPADRPMGFYLDGMHPSAEGHEHLAAGLAPFLSDIIGGPPPR